MPDKKHRFLLKSSLKYLLVALRFFYAAQKFKCVRKDVV